MNDKQRKLIDYFNSLPDPAPPPDVSVAAGVEEGAPTVTTLVEPPAATSESILGRLEKRTAPAPLGALEFAVLGGDADAGAVPDNGDDLTDVAGWPTAAYGWNRLGSYQPPSERPVTPRVLDIAAETIDKAKKGEDLSPAGEVILEQVILPGQRPVLDVIVGKMSTPPAGWEFLEGFRAQIETPLPAIGRIDVPGLFGLPYAGTGFVVGPDLLLTNRHVAEVFVTGVGRGATFLSYRSGLGTCLDPKYEVGDPDPGSGPIRFQVTEALLVHPHWDAALLRVQAADGASLPAPLPLARQPPPFFGGGAQLNVVVIGYPALTFEGNVAEQMNIFRGVFGRKRIAPGFLNGFASTTGKYGATVQAVTHDSSTLRGSSGSAIVDLTSGLVVGLHFAGAYLEANYGVPTWEMAQDTRIADFGVRFENYPGASPNGVTPIVAPGWLSAWEGLQPLVPNGG